MVVRPAWAFCPDLSPGKIPLCCSGIRPAKTTGEDQGILHAQTAVINRPGCSTIHYQLTIMPADRAPPRQSLRERSPLANNDVFLCQDLGGFFSKPEFKKCVYFLG